MSSYKNIGVYMTIVILLLTGCAHSSNNLNGSVNGIEEGKNHVYAADTNNDGKYDSFDSDGDGVLDINTVSPDSNIDYSPGKIADFSVTSINGVTYDNESFSKNRLNIVIIWGYWCPDCMYELYHLANYQPSDSSEYVNYFDTLPSDVGVLGISVGSSTVNGEDIEKFTVTTNQFCSVYGVNFDNVLAVYDEYVLLDSIRTYKTENRDYSSTVPAVALIDPQGNIIEVIYEGSAEQIVKEIEDNL